jgi:hypothetical protein
LNDNKKAIGASIIANGPPIERPMSPQTAPITNEIIERINVAFPAPVIFAANHTGAAPITTNPTPHARAGMPVKFTFAILSSYQFFYCHR